MVPIRSETLADLDAIGRVHRAAFPTDGEARLVDALRESGRLLVSLVALDAGEVVGHVAFSPVTACDATAGLGLAPVAVLDSHRRRGIAEALITQGLERAREIGCGWVVVLGEPAYYAQFGFEPAPSHGLRDEYEGGDAFQVLRLSEDVPMPAPGLVKYAPEFAAL